MHMVYLFFFQMQSGHGDWGNGKWETMQGFSDTKSSQRTGRTKKDIRMTSMYCTCIVGIHTDVLEPFVTRRDCDGVG